MSSFYFLAILIGIGWLCVWSVLPQPWTGGWWWPFDMRRDADEAAPDTTKGSGRRKPLTVRARTRASMEDRKAR